ncbi:hypothetical protein FRB97_002150 [Tulasnella sp. 331]|nr:hypothetical protein FRB97_002150 [Tulasnella sp. 331]KAG8885555.1 hypothetical protein FRB98_001745 [Tulasnella sp. 332]
MIHRLLLNSLSAILFIATIPSIYAAANPLVQVKANIGPNPTRVGMYTYTPSKLANPPPLVVAIHGCGGSAKGYFTKTRYATLADTYGFIVVYPNAPAAGGCFDVHTNATLTHNGGGDSQGIASMITYSIATYNVSANNVYVTGTDSGAMMANVLAGSYPELFQAASAYSGVAFGCFAGPAAWNTSCADGDVEMSGADWAALVYGAYPGYTGSRPKMAVWQGDYDETIYSNNWDQEIIQWVTVLNYSLSCATSTLNYPLVNYTMWTYGVDFIAISADGVGHPVPVDETFDLAWFGIITPTTTITDPTCTTPTPTPTPPAAHYGQCGGYVYDVFIPILALTTASIADFPGLPTYNGKSQTRMDRPNNLCCALRLYRGKQLLLTGA